MFRDFTHGRGRTGLVLASLAVLAAGCGGGRLSEDEFVAKVTTICGAADEAVTGIDFGRVDPTSDEATDADLRAFAVGLDKALEIYREEAESLRGLKPPMVFQAQFDDAMNALSSSLTAIESASTYARNGDKGGISSTLSDLSLYGENACGGASGVFTVTTDGDLDVLLAGKERGVEWSPDGRWIASPAPAAGRSDIVSVRDGTHHPAESWAWSSDGSRLAYSNGTRLLVGPNAAETVLVTRARGSDPLDWAPDGSRFVLGSGRTTSCCWPSLQVARADGTGVRTVWTPPSDGPRSSWVNGASWSPSGRLIAVGATINNGVASRHGGEFLYLVDAERGGARKVASTADAAFEGWSPDGKWIVLLSDRSVYRLSPTDGKAVSLCPQSCPGAVLAADGRRFAFATTKPPFAVWVGDVGSGTRRRVADVGRSSELAWSADGRHLGLVLLAPDGRQSTIAVVDVATRRLRRLTDGRHLDSDPRISMDGSFAAFRRGQDLWVAGAAGKGARRVATIGACGRYAWSPSERRLAFTNGPCLPS